MIPLITNSRAVERQFIEESLRALPRGETVSYEALSEAAGCPIKDVWHVLSRVREDLIMDGYVFDVIRNIGLRRFTDAEIATVIPGMRRGKIHRQARRGASELSAIESVSGLSDIEKTAALIGRSLFGAIFAITTRKAAKALAETVSRTGVALPVDETIETFRGIS